MLPAPRPAMGRCATVGRCDARTMVVAMVVAMPVAVDMWAV